MTTLLEDVETRLQQQRAWKRQRNWETRIIRTYGITLEDYDDLLESQNGVCAICRQTCSTNARLSIDHDHDTLQVRGLLCKSCNLGIGNLKNIDNLIEAITYLQRYDKKVVDIEKGTCYNNGSK